jgi:hypothetical protein
MIITRTHLSRRTVLRGAGAAIALPLLDSMVPAYTAVRATAAAPIKRLGVVYLAMGFNMKEYTPPQGALQITPTLQPLAAFKDRLTIVSGLDMAMADATDGGGQHSRIGATWLTGVRARRTEGPDLRAGTSMDQIVAKELGNQTQLSSLELAIEGVDLVGACELGYTCAYTATTSWRSPTTPLPMEINPRAVFERLFGAADSTDSRARLAQLHNDRSILDSVAEDMQRLRRRLGDADNAKLAEYVDAVRDVERRIHKAEEQAERELPVVEQPAGIPPTFEEHAKLMFELLLLAYQTDLTRVGTFLLARELSVRTYPEIGVPDPHHPLSHHQDNPEKLAKQAKLNVFHLKQFAQFLERMAATPDGEGSLLDHTLLLCGSGMSNSNLHLPRNVPTIVVGGRTFNIAGGRHVQNPDGTPLTNLQLTLMDRMNVPVENFGDSNGRINLVDI